MNILTIDKSSFLKGQSTSKFIDDGGYSPTSNPLETTRRNGGGGFSLGLLFPKREYAAYNTNLADVVYASVANPATSKMYSIGSGGRVYETASIQTTPAHTVKATIGTVTFNDKSDIIVYDGKLFITSTTNIALSDFTFTGADPDNDWWTAVAGGSALDANYVHKLFIFQGTLYITNGNKLASWDGTTAKNAALTLPAGWIITDATIYNNQICLVAVWQATGDYNALNKFFFWDGYTGGATSSMWNREVEFYGKPILGLAVLRGVIYFYSAPYIYAFNGYNYTEKKEIALRGSTFKNFISAGGCLYFSSSGPTLAELFSYNPIYNSINKLDNFSLSYNPRVLVNFDEDYIMSFINDTDATLSKFFVWKSYYIAYDASFISNFYNFPAPINIRKVEILFEKALKTGDSYEFAIYDEAETSLNTKTISYAVDTAITKKTYLLQLNNLSAIQARFKFKHNSGATIPTGLRSIKIYYDGSERNTTK